MVVLLFPARALLENPPITQARHSGDGWSMEFARLIDFVAAIGEPVRKAQHNRQGGRMADQLGYGQPIGGIAQTAFIVSNLHEAIGRWVADMRAGPFFVLPHFLVPRQTYRGEESRADITIGMGFAGHMLIELIQPLDEEPSVYQETMSLRGYGFHHLGLACADVDAASEAYQARGYHEAFRAAVPTGGEVVYLDNGTGAQLGFLELLPVTPGMDATFTRFWEASRDWDGSDPVRPFL
jgi:hypothetical protein